MTDKELLSCINALPSNFNLIKKVSTDTLDYSISIEDDTLLVTMGGTVGSIWPPSKDWLIDFEFWTKLFENDNIEYGFLSEAEIIIADIEKVLKLVDVKKMFLTGFSKGGAHAAIIHDHFRDRYSVYSVTAGAPMAFAYISRKKARTFDGSFIRYHFITDLVPHLPLSIMGFRHIGKGVLLGWHDLINAHSLNSYIARMK